MKVLTKFDVSIVGGGFVGAATAIGLAQNGIHVALIDQMNIEAILNASYDGRTLAIAHGSRLILEKWGIWQDIDHYAEPIHQIRVSGARPGGILDYHAREVVDHPMGYNLEVRFLRRALIHKLQNLDHCQIFMPAAFQSLQQNHHNVKINLKDGSSILATCAIGADGRESAVRQAIDIHPRRWSYDQTALVSVISHDKPHNGIAFEHFLPQGPLAFLPMHGNRSSMVWTLPTATASAFYQLDKAILSTEIQRRFGHALGKIHVEGACWAHPIHGHYCREWYKNRVVLVGDACHAIHPVAGQGFNLGLRDAYVLVTEMTNAHIRGQDLGSQSLLKSYQQQRRVDSLSMTAMTHGLVRLFSNHSLTLSILTTLGMKITNRMIPLKKILTRHAMGLTQR